MKKTLLLLTVFLLQIPSTFSFSQSPAPSVLGTSVLLKDPADVAIDNSGKVLFVDRDAFRVWKMAPDGSNLSVVMGNGIQAPSGDGGSAINTSLSWPLAVTVDANGNIYIADRGADRVRKVAPNGIVSTVAGNGTEGISGDGGPAINAQLYDPSGLAVDKTGNLWIVNGSSDIRKVTPEGIITTIKDPTVSTSQQGEVTLTRTKYTQPTRVTADSSGNIFLADTSYNHRIRKIALDGSITTVAGTGSPGFSGDGGPATAAELKDPRGLAFDKNGNLYIADSGNNRIRKISPDGKITTIAGTGKSEFSGDGGPAINAGIYYPDGLAVDASGNIFFADRSNDRIRKITPDGKITTVAGK
ncbi:MAG TPA: hypothetical protein DF383_07190 [Deltaproteobacteria bacterium]|nr:hypothetical protein [Deltaproteobacteria bacterium]